MKNNFLRHAIGYSALAALLFLFAFPLLWMISYSLRLTSLPPPTHLELFVPPFAFENYSRVVRVLPLLQYAWNSAKVVAIAVPVTVVTASLAGFALTQISPRARLALVAISIAMLLVPTPGVWVAALSHFRAIGMDELAPASRRAGIHGHESILRCLILHRIYARPD